jgi:hypothetical protein
MNTPRPKASATKVAADELVDEQAAAAIKTAAAILPNPRRTAA